MIRNNAIFVDFVISDTVIKRTDKQRIFSRLEGYLYARFRFNSSWPPDRKVIFSRDGTGITLDIADGFCQVPNVYLAFPGTIKLSVFSEADGRRTANEAEIMVELSGYQDALEPPEPAPPPGVFV